MSTTYPILTKPLTRSTIRPVTRLAVGAAVHGSVPGQTQYHPYAKDYFGRVEALGGGFANHYYAETETKAALSDFFRRLDDTGVWPAIAELYLMAGVNFAGLPAKAKYVSNDSANIIDFVSGDYTPASALIGLTNESTKYIDTMLPTSDILGDPTVMPGIGALMVCELPPSGSGVIIGTDAVSGGSAFGYHTTPSVVRFRFQSSTTVSGSNPSEQCSSAFLTDPTAAMRVVDDLVLGPYAYTKGTGVSSSTIKLFNTTSRDFPFIGRMMAAWLLTDPTPQQIIDLHAAVTSLRGSLS